MRLIKKYPNRRLYDTAVSSYITLDDVRRLVIDREPFEIHDARSGKDITRSILLQIISEKEEEGEPIFSTEVLEEIVRFYGDELQGMISSYIAKSLRLFVDQQDSFRRQMGSVLGADPFAATREVTERNLALWREMQDSFLSTGSRRPRPRRATKPPPEDPGSGSSSR